MLVRKTERVLCLYFTEQERDTEKNDMSAYGYKLVREGIATFDANTVKGTNFKAGELALFAEYEKNI